MMRDEGEVMSDKSGIKGFWGRLPFKMQAVMVCVALVFVAAAGAVAYWRIDGMLHPGPTLTNETVAKELVKIQDLTTAKETSYGFENYSEGNVAFIDKKSFTMFYSYEARAGVDLEQAKIEIANGVVHVTLPAPTIQSISVDPESLRFFDTKTSLFSSNGVEDAAEALKDAKKKTEEDLNKGELLEMANEQAKSVIESVLNPVAEISSYDVVVTTTDPAAGKTGK